MKNLATPTLGVESSTFSSRTAKVRSTECWLPAWRRTVSVPIEQGATFEEDFSVAIVTPIESVRMRREP